MHCTDIIITNAAMHPDSLQKGFIEIMNIQTSGANDSHVTSIFYVATIISLSLFFSSFNVLIKNQKPLCETISNNQFGNVKCSNLITVRIICLITKNFQLFSDITNSLY